MTSLHQVYQFFHDAENLRDWISAKLKTATVEGYGKDYEHWQVKELFNALNEKFWVCQKKYTHLAGSSSMNLSLIIG